MSKIRVGVIGFAHTHVNGFLGSLIRHPDVEIIGISDENRSYTKPYDEKFTYYADYRDLLALGGDAIVICSENVHHARLAVAAATAGQHIFCEKPLGTTERDMQNMVEASRANHVQLMVAFSNRYVPSVQRAKEAIERGDIGDIVAIHATNKGSLPKREWFTKQELSGGGALLDHSVHVVDLMNWMLQSRIVEVYAEADTLFHEIELDDTGMLHFTYENGVVGVLDTSWSRARSFPMRRDLTMDVIGTHGVLSVDVRNQVNEIYSDVNGKLEWSDWSAHLNDLIIGDFIHCIKSGRPVPITGEDGLRSTRVALAAYESVRRGVPVWL